MKRTILIPVLLTCAYALSAQNLSQHMQQFADLCLSQREAIRTPQPDYDRLFEQLYNCLKTYTTLPLEQGASILHPDHTFSHEELAGHILFAPDYLADYLTHNIPDPYTESVQYVTVPEHKRATDEDKVIYHNSLLLPLSEVNFRYRVSQGEQQLFVLAEDDTQLDVTVTTGTQETTVSTSPDNRPAQCIWMEDKPYAMVKVNVKNTSDKHVSFVIAVY